MKIIISPAKKLNIENGVVNKQMQFNFTKEASVLINILQNKSVKDIKRLMSLSDTLAALNWSHCLRRCSCQRIKGPKPSRACAELRK